MGESLGLLASDRRSWVTQGAHAPPPQSPWHHGQPIPRTECLDPHTVDRTQDRDRPRTSLAKQSIHRPRVLPQSSIMLRMMMMLPPRADLATHTPDLPPPPPPQTPFQIERRPGPDDATAGQATDRAAGVFRSGVREGRSGVPPYFTSLHFTRVLQRASTAMYRALRVAQQVSETPRVHCDVMCWAALSPSASPYPRPTPIQPDPLPLSTPTPNSTKLTGRQAGRAGLPGGLGLVAAATGARVPDAGGQRAAVVAAAGGGVGAGHAGAAALARAQGLWPVLPARGRQRQRRAAGGRQRGRPAQGG